MKKYQWAAGILIVFLAVLCIVFWQQKNAEIKKMESLCEYSAAQAAKYFSKYEAQGKDSDYVQGVAEYRSFLNAYLYLDDNTPNDDILTSGYIIYSSIYGSMLLRPEEVQCNVRGLIEALECLSTDYDSEKGFQLMHSFRLYLSYGSD